MNDLGPLRAADIAIALAVLIAIYVVAAIRGK